MEKINFYIVDVFAEEKYAGNQLAVFVNAGSLPDPQMQKIAREMNYSETTFVLSSELRAGGYDVRIFTPQQEIPFAGHPTLGTAYIIRQEILKGEAEKIKLNLPVGQIPVTVVSEEGKPDIFWMQPNPPTFGQKLTVEAIAPVLHLDPQEIDPRFPIQEVSTGFPFIIVPLQSRKALQQARIDREKLLALVANTEAKAVLIFCPETRHAANQLSVRVFVDYFGIPEDPATGSANGCLAGYLVQYTYFGQDWVDLRVEQGYEINRPALLLLKAEKNGAGIEVLVGGQAVLVAKGELC
jgi:trans-2,3-dihydro-3-hydroxyanthranilate isomerase